MKYIRLLFLSVFIASPSWSSEHYRLYDLKKNDLIFRDTNGQKIALPSGTRVTKFSENKYIVFNPTSSNYEMMDFEESDKVIKEISPQNKSENCFKYSNFNKTFLNEAQEAIEFARNKHLRDYNISKEEFKSRAPHFADYLDNLEKKLHLFKLNMPSRKKMIKKMKRFNQSIKPENLNNLDRMQFHADLLTQTFDPTSRGSNIKFSKSTLYVPLSLAWLKGHPDLNSWYNKNWTQIGSPLGGSSGEGIVKFDNDPESYFNQNKNVLLKLKNYIFDQYLKITNTPLMEGPACYADSLVNYFNNSPEVQWLMQLEEKEFDKIDRMIFLHEKTWEEDNTSAWADYIPIDQSISCFQTNRFLSTLIHEANVNSYQVSFFAADTHAQPKDEKLSEEENFNRAQSDAKLMKSFTAREPSLQCVYLDLILNQ